MENLDIRKLPREPIAALKVALVHGIARCGNGNAKIKLLKQQNFSYYNDLFISLKVALASAERHPNKEFRDFARDRLKLEDDEQIPELARRFDDVYNSLLAHSMHDHFLPENELIEFDEANLNEDEKDTIASFLDEARRLARASEVLSDEHKRRICHRISLAENELFKPKAGFAAFLSAAYEASGLVRQFGEDVQPVADAIEKARTTTQKKVEGYSKLPIPDKPKQLPKPSNAAENE